MRRYSQLMRSRNYYESHETRTPLLERPRRVYFIRSCLTYISSFSVRTCCFAAKRNSSRLISPVKLAIIEFRIGYEKKRETIVRETCHVDHRSVRRVNILVLPYLSCVPSSSLYIFHTARREATTVALSRRSYACARTPVQETGANTEDLIDDRDLRK